MSNMRCCICEAFQDLLRLFRGVLDLCEPVALAIILKGSNDMSSVPVINLNEDEVSPEYVVVGVAHDGSVVPFPAGTVVSLVLDPSTFAEASIQPDGTKLVITGLNAGGGNETMTVSAAGLSVTAQIVVAGSVKLVGLEIRLA